MKSEQQNEREREQGRNVLEITRKTKSQTKSEDRYWGQVFMCGGEKTSKKKRKKKKNRYWGQVLVCGGEKTRKKKKGMDEKKN